MAGLTTNSSTSQTQYQNPFKASWTNRAIVVAIVAYLFYSFSTLGFDL